MKILRGAWSVELFRILEGFPDPAHDDEVDASSGSLEILNLQMRNWGPKKPIAYRQQAEHLRVKKGRLMRRQPKAQTLAPLAGNRGFESTSSTGETGANLTSSIMLGYARSDSGPCRLGGPHSCSNSFGLSSRINSSRFSRGRAQRAKRGVVL